MNEWSIEHVLIAVGTPRANGQAERLNRVIVSMLSKLVEDPRNRKGSQVRFNRIFFKQYGFSCYEHYSE